MAVWCSVADIRAHIRAIVHRDRLAERMQGRADIIKWAPALMAVQDAGGSDVPVVLAGMGPPFPTATELVEALIAGAELPMDQPGGLPVPGGVRLPLLHWSPVLQFARMRSHDGRVGGQIIEELPRTFSTLATWLERSIGLMPAVSAPPVDGVQDEGFDREEVLALFRKRFTFSFDEFARWLIDLRGSDPVLYVLLLSREYRLALQRCPEMGDVPAPGSSASTAMPALKVPPILAAMTIGELQRMVALTRDLSQRTGQHVRKVAGEIGDRQVPEVTRGRRMAGAISRGDGAGFLYDHAPMRVEAIRKRVFLLARRDLSTLDKDSFLRAVFGGRDDWDHVMSAGRRAGAHELIASMLAPDIFRKRTAGRGLGHHKDALDLYYGVPASQLPYAALTELSQIFCNTRGREDTSPIADRVRAVATSSALETEGAHERKHRSAVRHLPLYLRPYPKPGSGGRFIAVAWLAPDRDAALFGRLLRPVTGIDPRMVRLRTRWMYPIALRYLQLSFPRLYRHVSVHGQSSRIMAQLATSAAAFTSDPIFYRVLADSVSRVGPSGKTASNFTRRPPPSSLLPLSREMIDRVRDDDK
jgi:hypothetical protein